MVDFARVPASGGCGSSTKPAKRAPVIWRQGLQWQISDRTGSVTGIGMEMVPQRQLRFGVDMFFFRRWVGERGEGRKVRSGLADIEEEEEMQGLGLCRYPDSWQLSKVLR